MEMERDLGNEVERNGIYYELTSGDLIRVSKGCDMLGFISANEGDWELIYDGADPIAEGWEDGCGNTLSPNGWGLTLKEWESEGTEDNIDMDKHIVYRQTLYLHICESLYEGLSHYFRDDFLRNHYEIMLDTKDCDIWCDCLAMNEEKWYKSSTIVRLSLGNDYMASNIFELRNTYLELVIKILTEAGWTVIDD